MIVKSLPFLSYTGLSITVVLIYKSPTAAPFSPAFPLPETLILESLSIPAGIFILICSLMCIYPFDLHFAHGSITFSPVPEHTLQGEAKREPSLVIPVPWHAEHVVFLPPVPLHDGHCASLLIFNS